MFVHMALMRAQTALRAGELELAEMYSQRALAVAEELGQGPRLWATMWHGRVLLERGRAEEAGRAARGAAIDGSGLWQGLMLFGRSRSGAGRARRA